MEYFMPDISVKNVPENILEKLRQRARRHHRSLQGEMMVIIEEATDSKSLSIEEAESRLAASGLKTGDDAALWVRELRDVR